MPPFQPNPNDLRIAVRQASYPNTAREQEVVGALDRAVFDRVRAHEQALVEQAERARAEAKVDEEAALQIAVSLRREVLFKLDRPINGVDLESIALRYKRLRDLGHQAIRALDKAQADEAFLQPKLAAPYEDIVALWDKWPIIRPAI